MMRFDLHLTLFRHVVEAGSITHGAARANLALAAASTRIRAMETSLGAALLTRSRLGVVPTPAGRTLLAHARGLIAGIERMQASLSAYSGGTVGQIRVLANTNALTEFLPDALAAYLTRNPGVSVEIDEHTSDEIVGLVADGQADLGILSGLVDTGALQTFPFRKDRFVLVAARGHALAERETVSFAEVLAHDLVGLDRATRSRASSPTRRPASGARCACACNCGASTPSAASSRPASGSASCPRAWLGGWRARPRHRRRAAGRALGDPRPDPVPAQLRRAAGLRAGLRQAFASTANRLMGLTRLTSHLRRRKYGDRAASAAVMVPLERAA